MWRNQHAVNRSMERLATGKKINRASDDPAGMISAEQLEVEARTINKKLDALEFETTRLAAYDGAHSVVGDMLIELQGLFVSAANTGAMTKEEREALQLEADSILEAIDYVALTTTFDGQQVLSGVNYANLGVIYADSQGRTNPDESRRSLADFKTGGKFNLIDGDRENGQKSLDEALSWSRGIRGAVGNRQKSIESEIAGLQIEFENIMQAKSRIMDTDFAAETAELVRAQALKHAAQFTVQFAMQHKAQTVLALLPV